jgi:hypothetical protein
LRCDGVLGFLCHEIPLDVRLPAKIKIMSFPNGRVTPSPSAR